MYVKFFYATSKKQLELFAKFYTDRKNYYIIKYKKKTSFLLYNFYGLDIKSILHKEIDRFYNKYNFHLKELFTAVPDLKKENLLLQLNFCDNINDMVYLTYLFFYNIKLYKSIFIISSHLSYQQNLDKYPKNNTIYLDNFNPSFLFKLIIIEFCITNYIYYPSMHFILNIKNFNAFKNGYQI